MGTTTVRAAQTNRGFTTKSTPLHPDPDNDIVNITTPDRRGIDLPITTVNKSAAEPPEAVATKRAFAYLRVSSEGQVRTDYSDDGLSIDAQREGAEEKAVQLEAEIVASSATPAARPTLICTSAPAF